MSALSNILSMPPVESSARRTFMAARIDELLSDPAMVGDLIKAMPVATRSRMNAALGQMCSRVPYGGNFLTYVDQITHDMRRAAGDIAAKEWEATACSPTSA